MASKMLKSVRTLAFLPLKLTHKLQFKLNKIKGAKGIDIRGNIMLINSGSVTMGKNVIINSSKYKNIIGGDTRTSIVVRKSGNLTIGNNVKISNSAIYCTDKISIGENVMIGGSTKIWDTDFHPLNPQERNTNPNEGFNSRPIIIEDNVFIGGFSIILKGVTIGKNSIIGASSVVSKNVPSNEIWGGNPAMFVKKI